MIVAFVVRSSSDRATERRACTFCELIGFISVEIIGNSITLSAYLCRGWGLNLACPYIRTFCGLDGSLSMGGGKKLFFEPCRCSGGGVGSQS